MNTELLEAIGLTKSEIKVYLALLELGSSSTGPIVEKSGASSSKIYEILEKLIQKGLASFVIKSGTKYFEAADPKRILDYLEEKKKSLEQQSKEIKDIIPQLELKKKLTKEKSETLVFKGMEGARTAFEDMLKLKKGEEITIMGFSDVPESFQTFLVKWHKKRSKLDIKARALFGPQLSRLLELNKLPYTQVKAHPETLENPVAVLTYQDKTLFSLPNDALWIQVKNKRLADANRNRFEEAWTQQVTVFSGMEGLKTAFSDVFTELEEGDVNRAFVVGELDQKMNEFFKEQYEKRAKKGITTKTVFSEQGRKYFESRKNISKFEGKVINAMASPATVNVYGNKVNFRIGKSKDVSTIVIDNKDLAQSFKEQFDLLWNQDVQVYKGFDNVMNKFRSMLDQMKPGEEYFVLGATYGEQERLKKWFYEYHKERISLGIKVKLLSVARDYQFVLRELIQTGDPQMKTGAVKKLSPEFSNPMQINLYPGNKVLMFLFGKEMTCFEIESEVLHKNFTSYFDILWNQDTVVTKGIEALNITLDNYLRGLGPGESYDVLGATFGVKDYSFYKEDYAQAFRRIHEERTKKGIKTRLLFQQRDTHAINKFLENIYCGKKEAKILPYKTKSPVAILPSSNQTLIIIHKKEPSMIAINNKEVSQSFKQHFESLWNQQVQTFEGQQAVETAYESIFDKVKKTDEVLIFAAKPATNRGAEYNIEWAKKLRPLVKKFRLMYYGNSETNKNRSKEFENIGCQTKILPTDETLAISTVVIGDVILNSVWDEKPLCFKIENKTVADSLRANFDLLWDQETRVVKGIDAIEELFEEMLEVGSCDFMGARGYFVDKRPTFIDDWETRAIKRGFKMRNIVDESTKGHRITTFPFATTRYNIPKEYSPLSVFWIFGEKVVISNWTEKEPTIIIIENKALHDLYKKQFETMWKHKMVLA